MSRGEEVAAFLVDDGREWSAAEMARHFNCTHNSIQSAMTSVRRLCTLTQRTKSSKTGRPEIYYMAIVDRGVGLLSMNKPITKLKPYVVHAPND